MSKKNKFKKVDSSVNFINIEHEILDIWNSEDTFNRLRKQNKGNEKWSFIDGPITANNPMGVHHAWGRTLKDLYQRYNGMLGKELRYQNGFDCQGLWVEVEVEKELGFKSKRDVEQHGIEKFVNLCKDRVRKFSKIQTEQSKRLGYWMDWDNSYYTMSDENNYSIWSFLKKLFEQGKIYKGSDVVPWSGRSGTSYSQMEIIEGRKLVAHSSVFVKFPLIDRKNESLLVWTTTPWTLTSNIAAAVNINLKYIKVRSNDGELYYFAEENFKFQRLDRQFKEKKQWVKGIPKLKTIEQIFKERGGYTIEGTVKGSELVGLKYSGPFDELPAQNMSGGFPFVNKELENNGVNAIDCHRVIDGGKDSIGNDIVVSGEGSGIVHIATGCGAIDNKIGKKHNLVSIAPLDDESKYFDQFDWLNGMVATDHETTEKIIKNIKDKDLLFYVEQYPHVYPHCWRSGDELVFRTVDEWYINMDWRDKIHKVVDDIEWIPEWGNEKEHEWLNNMGDWMISKKRFWGLALPIWVFDDGTFFVVGSKEELKELAVEGWDEFEGNSPHRPWIDKVKIKHPETGLIGTRIPDVGNPWLDAGIVPFSTLDYRKNKKYWEEWYPADFVTECFPGQFRNWFYSLLAMSTIMDQSAPFKTLLGHALVKDETGRDMHKSWGNAIWFEDAAEKMGVDVMRWLYASQNPEQNLRFGFGVADEVRKRLITLWNTYSFFVTYARLDDFDPNSYDDLFSLNLTKLDKWILAKVNDLVRESTSYYNEYQIYKFLDNVVRFIDDLSNWYVRRNRRRFWKSENDNDKKAAYATLYETLVKFIKIMAPIIPFITEKMYKNLVANVKVNAPNSVHLTRFPKYEESWVDDSLIAEIDTIISIVSMGRSARNIANIKNRQPVEKLIIYSNENIQELLENNKNQILDELNIKNLKFVKNQAEIVSYDIKPNFQILGQKFGKNIKDVINIISGLDSKMVVNKIKFNKSIKIDLDGKEYLIEPNDIILKEKPVGDYSIVSNQKYIVGIYTILSDSLVKEGIVRDMVRHIQSIRKELGFNVEDRIHIKIEGSDDIIEALNENESYFLNEVLGVSFNDKSLNYESFENIKSNGENVKIFITKYVRN
tara:strand:+ start:1021 stop:4344 length:3324 start_codon:yes stop_codon:yes gene_type:complete